MIIEVCTARAFKWIVFIRCTQWKHILSYTTASHTAARKIFLLLIIFDWLAVERNRSDCWGKSKHTFTVCLFFYCQATLFTLRDNDCEQIAGVPACVRSFIPSHHCARLTRWQVYCITAILMEVRSQYKCRNYVSFFLFFYFFPGAKQSADASWPSYTSQW